MIVGVRGKEQQAYVKEQKDCNRQTTGSLPIEMNYFAAYQETAPRLKVDAKANRKRAAITTVPPAASER